MPISVECIARSKQPTSTVRGKLNPSLDVNDDMDLRFRIHGRERTFRRAAEAAAVDTDARSDMSPAFSAGAPKPNRPDDACIKRGALWVPTPGEANARV